MERTYDERVDRLKDLRNQIDNLEEEATALSKDIVADHVIGDKIEGEYANGTIASKEIKVIDPRRLKKELVKRLGDKNGNSAFMNSVTVAMKKAANQLPGQSFDRLAEVVKVSEYVTTKYK